MFPEHLSTADLTISINKVGRFRHLNHSGAPVAGEAAVTSGSPFSFLSNLCVVVKV